MPLKTWILIVCLPLAGCSAAPLVVLPATSIATTQYYKARYLEYDEEYRDRIAFQDVSIPRGEYSLYGRTFGDWSDSESPVIILMHGFPDSLHLYDELAPKLADGYRVLSFDFLGWGRSEKPRRHSYDSDSLLADLEAAIAFADTRSVTLVVHDASGPPGIRWALDNPHRVELLVLLNTFFHPSESVVKPEAISTFSTPGLRRVIARTGATISNVGFRIGYQGQLRRFICRSETADRMIPPMTYQAMKMRRAFFRLNDVLDDEINSRSTEVARLAEYPGQVLILFGREDPYLNLGMAREFHALFPNSQLEVVDGGAHFVQLDQPEAVSQAILGFDETAYGGDLPATPRLANCDYD